MLLLRRVAGSRSQLVNPSTRYSPRALLSATLPHHAPRMFNNRSAHSSTACSIPSNNATMTTNDHGEHAPIDRKADITIVGGGLAGLAACIEAATRNPSLSIVLVEKEGKLGGNSAKASSGINAALNDDDAPVFEKDTLESGTGLAARPLVDVFVRNSRDAIAFLEKQGHVDLSVLSQLGGHSAKRTHRNAQGPNVGFAIVSALQKLITDHIESHDWHIDVVTSASAEQVLFENGRVTGLVIDRVDKTGRDEGAGEPLRETIESPIVILATGGYSANPELLKKFAPGVENFPTTNGPWAHGDGIGLAQQLGAELVLMDKVQLHPTAFINPKDRSAKHKFLAPEAIRGSGALLINSSGKRFVNELATRDKVAAAILSQPSKDAYMLLFEGAKDMETTLGFYKHMGLVQVAHSIEEAAALCHVDAFVLQQTLNDYAEVSHSQQPDAFGKTVFPHPLHYAEDVTSHMEIHVMEVAPAVHYTMGGVKINEHAQVLRSDDSAIVGLYAAGEVSGGLHGANRLGGNSLAECVVFGRIAAQQAVQQLAH